MVSILALFYLATVLATFYKIRQFFPNHLATLLTTFLLFPSNDVFCHLVIWSFSNYIKMTYTKNNFIWAFLYKREVAVVLRRMQVRRAPFSQITVRCVLIR